MFLGGKIIHNKTLVIVLGLSILFTLLAACSDTEPSLSISLLFVREIPQTTLAEYRLTVKADKAITRVDLIDTAGHTSEYSARLVDGEIDLSVLLFTRTRELVVIAYNKSEEEVTRRTISLDQ